MNGIQRGEVTHHQDQLILWVNLRTIKIKNSTTGKVNPFAVSFILCAVVIFASLIHLVVFAVCLAGLSVQFDHCDVSIVRIATPTMRPL